MTSSTAPLVVLGSGLAAQLAVLSLSKALGPSRPIIQVVPVAPTQEDDVYGGVTAPTAYNFLLGLGLDEPTLLIRSNAAFSYGTGYRQWLDGKTWVQCHHAPLPTPGGVPLRHLLARLNLPLQPLLVSAIAAMAGRFAHPPADPQSALSRAEYGYQFSASEWVSLLDQRIAASGVRQVKESVSSIDIKGGSISTIHLASGESLEPWLVVDASGPMRSALSGVGATFRSNRTVSVKSNASPAGQLGPAARVIDATASGWVATTSLQSGPHQLAISAGGEPDGLQVELGDCEAAWVGNCVGIGHAAAVLEPLSPAPMMLLQRDIERLLELLPATEDASVERSEYNRRYRNDVEHAGLFQSAITIADRYPDSPYWQAVKDAEPDPRLTHKMAQFAHRGALVSYDLEPFNEEDWTILHMGQGRQPRRHDRTADQMSDAELRQTVAQSRTAIEQLVPRMPPHGVYMEKLKQYLARQNHG